MTSLIEYMRKLLELVGKPQLPGEWETAQKAVEEALIQSHDRDEIKELIRMDSKFILSEPVRRLAFEKLLAMGDRTWQTLAGYGAHLTMYNPSDSEEWRIAKELIEEANRLKREEEQGRKSDNLEDN